MREAMILSGNESVEEKIARYAQLFGRQLSVVRISRRCIRLFIYDKTNL